MFGKGRVASWIFSFVWILACTEYVESDDNNCVIGWNETNLAVYWSGDTVDGNANVTAIIKIVNKGDKKCFEFSVTVNILETKIDLSMLCANTEYKVEIQFNYTNASSFCTTKTTIWPPPDTPINVVINEEDVTNTSFVVSWDKPGGDGEIQFYQVILNDELLKKDVSPNTNYSVTNLKPFVTYEVKVFARNANFSGKPSKKIEVTTKEGIPSSPLDLSVTYFTATSLFLSWKEPTPSVGPIHEYEGEWRASSTMNISTFNITENYFNITELMSYTNYTMRVRAKTSAGPGNWTDEITDRTAVGVPFPPTGLAIASTDSSLSLTWEEPVPFVGPIESFDVEWWDTNMTNTSSLSTTKKYFNITDLMPYANYTIRVRAKTSAGPGDWTDEMTERTAAGVPSSPTNVSIPSFTNTSLYLNWEEPAPSVGPIENYNVEWWDSNMMNTSSLSTTKKSFNITKLMPYTNYTMRVRANTSAGPGEWADEIMKRTDEGVPSYPTSLAVTSFTDTILYLTWEEPEPIVGLIENFEVQWKVSSFMNFSSVVTTETFLNITHLLPYTDYTMSVRAKTLAGSGAWADIITKRTAVGAPHAPKNFRSKSFTNTSIFLEWEEPLPSTGPILNYTVEYTSGLEPPRAIITDKTWLNITLLKPFTTYRMKVRAHTEADEGNWTKEITVKTDTGVPSSPSNVTIESSTNTSLFVSWKDPIPVVGHIENYQIEWRHFGQPNINITKSKEFQVGNLMPYTSYAIRVRARTSAGYGKWSNEVWSKTGVGVPRAPTALKETTVTNISIALTWKEPSPSTGPVLNYIVEFSRSPKVSEEKKTTSNKTSYVLGELFPYVNYTLRVLAVTKAGKGKWCDGIVVQTDIGVPHPPTELKNGSVTNNSVVLTWNEPSPSTGPISTYIVAWSNSTGRGEKISNSTNTNYNIDEGLLPYVNYTFQISAVTAAGRGNSSAGLTVQTSIGVPHEPTALKSGPVTNNSISLTWKEPSPSTGPVELYALRWSSSRGSGGVDTNSALTYFKVTGLMPYVNYTFQILAVTIVGKGDWSADLTVQTDIGVPTVPKHLEHGQITNVSISIKWYKPEFPNAPDLQYEVQIYQEESNVAAHVIFVTSNEEVVRHSIDGLLPFTHYIVRVSAITKAGQGQWTENLNVQTTVGVPQSAIIVDVSARTGRTANVIWSTRGPYPGPVRYSLQALENPGPCSTRSSYDIKEKVTGNKSREDWRTEFQQDRVTELSPYGSYNFLIVLRTVAVDGVESSRSNVIRIAPEAPGEPTDVIADCSYSSTEAKISWKPPKYPSGIISSYKIQYVMENKWGSSVIVVSDPCKGSNHVFDRLQPERQIKIDVYATVVNVSSAGKSAQPKGICILPAGIPFIGNTSRLMAKSSGYDYLTLEWTKDVFSEYMGAIIHYAVFVGNKDSLGNVTSGKSAENGPSWSNFSSGGTHFYQATPPYWNPFKIDADPLECKIFIESVDDSNNRTVLRCSIGSQSICRDNETYCNGPLKPDTQYEMKIRAFTRGGYTETHLIYARTGLLPKPSIVGTVVTVVMLLLLVLALVAGGYVVKKKGYIGPFIDAIQKKFKPKEEVSTRPSNESPLEHLEQSFAPRPIKTMNFATHVRIMMSDSHLKFSQEFEHLKNSSPRPPCSVAEMEENRFKNRWMNIFPFDHSRVKLLPLCDEPGSDFINANYIPGYSSRREYIATQGPLPHSVEDFWRMTWEQSVSMVVMLTQCVERGKKKCEQYWPESGETRFFGDLRVSTTSESVLSSYVIRIFKVQLGSCERRIKQMHFTNWPDFGCPESPGDLINFVRGVRDHLPRKEPGPLLVHCSAGVGRTGTFIVVDRMMQQLHHFSNNEVIDVYGTVLELRNHRTNMVQTEDQYIYIHLCIQQLIQERDRPPVDEYEEQVYSNIGVQRDTGV